jgi:hypothetical protein
MVPISPRLNQDTGALLRCGHIFLPNLLDRQQVERYLRREYAVEIKAKKNIILRDNLVFKDSDFLPLIDNEMIVRLVTSVMGPYIRIISTEYWIRLPGSRGEPWHIDGGPAMKAAKGLHLIKAQFFLTALDGKCNGNLLLSALGKRQQNKNSIRVTANPGDAIIWLGNLNHAVEANEGENSRHSIIIAYGYSWMSPYDFANIGSRAKSRMSPRQALLMNGYLGNFRRGVFYRPADEEQRKMFLSQHPGPVESRSG